jgi:putrescine aminotransferase
MTFAKGVTSGYLPLGGVFVSDRVANVLIEKAGEFFHGYTYSGHPVACAVAIANIRLIQEEKLVGRIKNEIGPYLQAKWLALKEHPLVGDARMVGLMGALELVRSKQPLERFHEAQGAGVVFRDLLMKHGVCLRAVGDTIICAPPFTLSESEADELIDKTWLALDLAQKALRG